jgi:hypothetical protein
MSDTDHVSENLAAEAAAGDAALAKAAWPNRQPAPGTTPPTASRC